MGKAQVGLGRLRRYFKKNFKYYNYPSRILIGLVYCAVLWAFLGVHSLPGQSTIDQECLNLTQNLRRNDSISPLLSSFGALERLIDTDLLKVYTPFAVIYRNDSSYEVILLRKHTYCSQNNIRSVTIFNESDPSFFNVADFGLLNYSLSMTNLRNNEDTNSLLYIPDGHFFALAVLLVLSSVFGVITKVFCLPALLGMISAGFLLRNLPTDIISDINPVWSSVIRNIALVIVLIRGGLSLSPKQLKRLKLAFLLLAFVPCILEGALDGIVATFYLELPWQWGFMLGYVIAAISPAIVVPVSLTLQEKGYGTEKGIPSLVISAASFDVVISISLFGVFLGLAFSEGQLILDIFRAPIQILIGLVYGGLFGLILWIVPLKKSRCEQQKSPSIVRNRFFLLFGLSLFAIFGSQRAIIGGSSLAGSGPLAVVILSFVAGQGWVNEDKISVSRVFYLVWQFAQPLLFGLIGAELDLAFITPSVIGQAFVLLLTGLTARLLTSMIVVLGNKFNWKEELFIAIAWLPKATVQAAIGSIALDTALAQNLDEEDIQRGRSVLTIAVIAIFVTAPLGGIAMSLLGPFLLTRKKKIVDDEEPDLQLHSDNPPSRNVSQVGELNDLHQSTIIISSDETVQESYNFKESTV